MAVWGCAAIGALALGTLSAYALPVAVITLAMCLTIMVALWARARGDTLVVAVALLVFWAPFHTTISRFNLSPQEVAVYLIILACLMLDRQGIWSWITRFFASVPRVSLVALALFALACLQSIALESGVGALDRVQALRSTLLYPALFALLVAYTVRSRQAERVVLQSFFGGAIVLAVYALSLKLLGVGIANGAVEGRLGAEASFLSQYHPNNIGLYFALALPFALPLWQEAAQSYWLPRLKRVGIACGVLLLLLDILLTASRGTLVALGVSVVVALGLLVWKGTMAQRAAIVASAAGVVGGVVALALWKGSTVFAQLMSLLRPSNLLVVPSLAFRFQLYERALQLIKAHPFTGVGLAGFAATGATPFSPHDTYLDLWVSVGIIGLLAFVFILAHGAWSSLRRIRGYSATGNLIGAYYSLGVIFALVAFFTQGFVEAYDAQPRIAPAIWMLALVAQVAVFRRMIPLDKVYPSSPVSSQEDPRVAMYDPDPGEQQPQRAENEGEQPGNAPPSLVWDWNLKTGPLPTIGQEPLPVIQDDPFQISSEFEAALLQEEVRRHQRAASSEAALTRRTTPPRLVPDESPDELVEASRAAFSVAASPGRAAPAVQVQPASEASALLNRAPSGFLWNQAYSLLVFGLSFVLSVIIARGLSAADYGMYSILSSIVSVLLLLFAFGMEDAASVFVPRLLARNGQAGAATLIRRMLVVRVFIVLGIGALLALGLPLVALPAQETGLAPVGFAQSVTGYAGLRSALLGVYLAGSAIVALQGAFFASVLKTRATLIIGGLSQALGVPLTLALLWMGYGVDGIFAAQVVVAWTAAVAFMVVLRPYLAGGGGRVGLEGRQVRSLMVSAWLTNVTNGALGKQMDIMLMSMFAVSYAAIGYYNLAYQIVSIVAVLLISGLGGVSVAAMSVTYAAYGPARLAAMWRAIVMLQLLLAVPLQIVAFVLADQLVETVYGPSYAGAAPLLRIFLLFSLAGRVLGGGANQSGLYVVGKQRLVLATRWGGFIINLLLDILLIQLAGPAGALIATGFSQLWVNAVEYLALRGHVPNRYPLALSLRVLTYSALAAIPVALLAPAGLIGLIVRGAMFVVVFLAAALLFRLGDPRDIVEIAALNPRIQWLIEAVSRFSARRVWQNRQAI